MKSRIERYFDYRVEISSSGSCRAFQPVPPWMYTQWTQKNSSDTKDFQNSMT